MFKRPTNRFVANPQIKNNQSGHRKCAHHAFSYNFVANMRKHDEIVSQAGGRLTEVEMNSTIAVKVAFHFLAPRDSYSRDKVAIRVHDILLSMNDDFNNYTANPNTMNNFRYKSIVNQVFTSNISKQSVYLSSTYLKTLPSQPSNIIFELGEVYFYPVKNRLSLGQYNDVTEVEMEFQAIKQYIHQNRADAIDPERILNMWIIDMSDTSILGFANFPWEVIDNFHGVVVHRRCFFPEDYGDTQFNNYKTFTHETGHYFGLLHVFSQGDGLGQYAVVNLNADDNGGDTTGDYIADTPTQLNPTFDPTDPNANRKLHSDPDYNPLFMNFMDYTYDKYVTMFTQNQLQKMRYMIMSYRPKINSLNNGAFLPKAKYNPDTDTIIGSISSNGSRFVSLRDAQAAQAAQATQNLQTENDDTESMEEQNESSNAFQDEYGQYYGFQPQPYMPYPMMPPFAYYPYQMPPYQYMQQPQWPPINNQYSPYPMSNPESYDEIQSERDHSRRNYSSDARIQSEGDYSRRSHDFDARIQSVNDTDIPSEILENFPETKTHQSKRDDRSYSKYAKAQTKINSLDPDHIPQPTDLHQAIQMKQNNRIDRKPPQFQTQQSKPKTNPNPIESKSRTQEFISQAERSDRKFNKYGQLVQPEQQYKHNKNRDSNQTPKKRFTRVKPASMDN